MAKTKAVQSSNDAQVKSLSSVKQGAVTKPSQTPKSKSKDIAKAVAVKADKMGKDEKKSKKAKKEPSPELSTSDSEEDSIDDEESSESSASSDESEAEIPSTKAAVKTNGVKSNGIANVAPKAESEDEDSESSESSASSDDDIKETTAVKSAPAAVAKDTVAGAKEKSESEDESEEDSDEDSSEDDEEESDEETPNKGPVDARALNGKLEEVASKEVGKHNDSTLDLVAVTDLYRFLPMRNLAAATPLLVPLMNHPMRTVKMETMGRLLPQLPRSAKLKLKPRLHRRRARPSQWVMERLSETFSLVVSRIMLTKNGSLVSSRASGSYPQSESLLTVTLAVPKGKPTSVIFV